MMCSLEEFRLFFVKTQLKYEEIQDKFPELEKRLKEFGNGCVIACLDDTENPLAKDRDVIVLMNFPKTV